MNRLHRVQRIMENSRAVEAHPIKALQKSSLGICTERSGRRQSNTLRSEKSLSHRQENHFVRHFVQTVAG